MVCDSVEFCFLFLLETYARLRTDRLSTRQISDISACELHSEVGAVHSFFIIHNLLTQDVALRYYFKQPSGALHHRGNTAFLELRRLAGSASLSFVDMTFEQLFRHILGTDLQTVGRDALLAICEQ